MNDSVVVLQSGIHDVSLPSHGRRDAPLTMYRVLLRRLAAMVRRLRLRNPAVSVVWKQTTHARQLIPPDGKWKAECDLYGFPQACNGMQRHATACNGM